MMREDKATAIELRKQGKSYSEIKKVLGIPLSTLSGWFKDEKWSNLIKYQVNYNSQKARQERLVNLNKSKGTHLSKLYEEARIEAAQEFQMLKNHPLFVAGISLYMNGGDLSSKSKVQLSGSNSKQLKIFHGFLTRICGSQEHRVKTTLLIYSDQNPYDCKEYWKKALDISENRFTNNILLKNRRSTAKVPHGLCLINISSRFLKEKMLVWMNNLAEELA